MLPANTARDINLRIRERETNRRGASEARQRWEQYLVYERFMELTKDMRHMVPSCMQPEASLFQEKYIVAIKVFLECLRLG